MTAILDPSAKLTVVNTNGSATSKVLNVLGISLTFAHNKKDLEPQETKGRGGEWQHQRGQPYLLDLQK